MDKRNMLSPMVSLRDFGPPFIWRKSYRNLDSQLAPHQKGSVRNGAGSISHFKKEIHDPDQSLDHFDVKNSFSKLNSKIDHRLK